jgi:hypothetical protein
MRLGETFPIDSRQRRKGSTLERDADGRKFCVPCGEWRSVGLFGPKESALDGLRGDCYYCRKRRADGRAETRRAASRLRAFRLSTEAFQSILARQGGTCAICGTTDPGRRDWCVDHDHACCADPRQTCGECVRGVLCNRCNLVLGNAGDSAALLRSAAAYLEAA